MYKVTIMNDFGMENNFVTALPITMADKIHFAERGWTIVDIVDTSKQPEAIKNQWIKTFQEADRKVYK